MGTEERCDAAGTEGRHGMRQGCYTLKHITVLSSDGRLEGAANLGAIRAARGQGGLEARRLLLRRKASGGRGPRGEAKEER